MPAAPDRSRNGADLVVECLATEGIRFVAGVPGTTIMDLLDSLARQDEIRFLVTRHEQVAGFLADGLSRRGDQLGVCVVSRGPGATNAAIAVENAHDESVPILVLVGQVAGGIADRQAFEEMDVLASFRPFSKWVVEIRQADRIPELLQRAVRTAVSGRPGPVVVSLPLDVLQTPVAADIGPVHRWRSHPAAPSGEALTRVSEVLGQSERPVLLLGGGAAGDRDTYLRLAEHIVAPVVTTWGRQNVVPFDDRSYLGALGYGAHDVSERAVREADVIVAIGCRFSEFTTKRWTLLDPATRLIHIDIDEAELGKVHVPEVGLVADGQLAAQAVMAAVPAPSEDLASARRARRRELRREYDTAASLSSDLLRSDRPATGVPGADLIGVLQGLARRDDVIMVQDGASFGPWMQRYLRLPRAGSLYCSAGGAMGWGFPASMGIALSHPDARVVTVCGDGSFWMVAQDFETCVREGIDTITIITNNFAYGNTRDRQTTAHDGRYLGVFYDNPDFAEFACSLGGYGVRVESASGLAEAVEKALAQGRPAIIDVIQDRMYGLPPGLVPLAAR
ncbi:thiamine pyrophosphate-binding protein [Nocardia takedensis]